MQIKSGNWSNEDNKHYRGKIDRIYVSESEAYEVEYFIDHYLSLRGMPITEANRERVGLAMESYSGNAPVRRDVLIRHVDAAIR